MIMFVNKILYEFHVFYMPTACRSEHCIVTLRMLPAKSLGDSGTSHAHSIMGSF
jgi:hypothetical protein